MSGAEAVFVVSLISAILTIIEASKTIYDAARDAKGQPEEFRLVAARLPLVTELLRSAEKKTKELDETAQEALEPILESCKAKAESLNKIFQKVIRKDDDKWYDRYKKALGALGKGNKVESLMKGILKDIQLLVYEKLRGTATEAQLKEIEEAIKQMNEMPSSLPEETGGVNQHHHGSGNNNANLGKGLQHNGSGDIVTVHGDGHFGDNYFRNCLQDLRTTDPRDDKKRIEMAKGGLRRDSYHWILDHPDFHKWRNNEHSRLLWIKGDPGKGKTMLLCGIIDELSPATALEDEEASMLLSYFFCQATDERIRSATAVLRGLIYLLAEQRPPLISYIQEKHKNAKEQLFKDANAWVALVEILTNMLADRSLRGAYLIIDALDECVIGLDRLQDFIIENSSGSSHVKWIVSSRNWPSIEKGFNQAKQKENLCLELNEKHVSEAVTTYIQFKVDWLAKQNNYEDDTQDVVQRYLSSNANDTFLWVALVCQELADISGWEVEEELIAFPPGLDALYKRMIDQICNSRHAKLLKSILAVVSAVYRPMTLGELASFVDIPPRSSHNHKVLAEIIGLCGSFLTLRERTIYFIHQSAKDFLIQAASNDIFPSGIDDMHHVIFSRSLQVMSRTLRRDVYNLRAPGITIDQVTPPDPDPLAVVRYSCLYWVDHLLDCSITGNSNDRKNGGLVEEFLCKSYLFWLEALSLMRSLPSSIVMIIKLEGWLQADESPNLYAFVHDAKRFSRYNRQVIEQAPLQLYCSALVFAPEKSVIRTIFEKHIPSWIQSKPKVQEYWSAALQTLEGHSDSVRSVAFSPDGKQVVSGSGDGTVRLWDAVTGAALQVLEGHSGYVQSVAFSPDGKQVVSGSGDGTVRLWDAVTGAALQVLEGHSDYVRSVAFSPDGKQVVSGLGDGTVRLWDAVTGAALQVLEGHSDSVRSVAFSPHGEFLPALLISNNWVVEGPINILLLPPDYRPNGTVAVYNKTIALSQSSGRILFIQFTQGEKTL
ncbi:hypothetical protein BJ875DRAFT_434854 [Amylocarpus encephaloides]|uniref:NACHT domain-containing protein n=1 Tax=Amylocarpus encephaloides TaxID=45428 RepID=A0A9P7Y7Y7_9HELO|nr:hypothetical protein BJ875DRAFT_434854 [Amylocarpus encephaloides]